MEETRMDAVTADTPDTAPETAPAEDMADDWDDIDLSDVETDEPDELAFPESEAPDPEQETEKQEETEPEPEQEGEKEDLTFTLKHLDEVREVGKDEVVALAQKGMDYDRIRALRDDATREVTRLTVYEDFLKELAATSGMSVEDLMDNTRANVLADKEGLDRSIALQRIKLDNERKALEIQRTKQKDAERMTAEEQRRRESIDRFVKKHPGLDARDIPKEVWENFAKGKDMEDAWALSQVSILQEKVDSLTKELESAQQNAANKARSTGSQKTTGTRQETEQDLFDKLWYDGT